ncbi:MAG: hypothetical protein Q9165_003688 [Trypethelium subeluteriae]
MPDTPKRRSARGPGRPRVRPLPPGFAPPPKRRKYIPGGPGGGGRYIDDEGKETPITGSGTRGLSFTAPRRTRPVIHDEEDEDDDLLSPAMVTQTASSSRPRRDRPPPRPRYSPAATAAAAVAQSDGYKPREERGWEEFHPDLDIEVEFMVLGADEVDGVKTTDTLPMTPGLSLKHSLETAIMDGASAAVDDAMLAQRTPTQLKTEITGGSMGDAPQASSNGQLATPKRRPGRPPRRPESMLTGLGSPPLPKIVPLPAQNPKERLNLPKPSFRKVDTFTSFEQDSAVQVNYVDRTMASVGFQESEMFAKPEKTLIRIPEGSKGEDLDMATSLKSDVDSSNAGAGPSICCVEYDMDEQDERWLDGYNAHRKDEQVEAIKPAIFEVTMTQIEKEWHSLEKRIPKPNPKPPQTHRPRSSSAAAVNGEPSGPGEEQDTKCAICDDGDCENTNAIVFCDGCDLAVHQECYGVPFIPEGQWLCRKCQLIGRGTPAFHVTCARRAKLFLKMKSTHGGPANLDASVLRAFCDKHVPPEWRRDNDVDRATAEAKSFYRHTMKGRRWADSQQSALTLTSSQPMPTAEAVEDGDEIAVAGTKRKRSNQPPKNVWRLPSGAPVVPHVVFNAVETSLQRFSIRKRKEYVAEACKYWTLKREARRGAALLKRLQLQMESFTSMEITRRNFAGMGAAGGPRLQRRIDFAEQLQKDMDHLRRLCAEVKEREMEKLKDVEILKEIIDTVYFPIPPLLWPILEKAEALDPKGLFADGFKSIQTKLEERFYTSVSTFSADIGSVFKSVTGLGSVTDAIEAHEQLNDTLAPGTVEHNSLSADEKEKKKLAKRIVKALQVPLEDATKKEAELRRKPFEKELKDLDALLESAGSRRNSISLDLDEAQADAGASDHVDHIERVNGVESGGENGVDDADVDNEDDRIANGIYPYEHQEPSIEIVTVSRDGTMTKMNGHKHSTSPDNAYPEVTDTTTSHPTIQKVKKEHSPKPNGHTEPLTPPSSEKEKDRHPRHELSNHNSNPKTASATTHGIRADTAAPLEGGIPWYVVEFDPVGTTIHDERWTGPSVLQEMSDGGLSDIDDDTMNDLEGEQKVAREKAEVERRRKEEEEKERARKKRKEQRRKSKNKCW